MTEQHSYKTVNKVSEMKLIAIDCVADPSYPDAFVNGILESKSWILNEYGMFDADFAAATTQTGRVNSFKSLEELTIEEIP